MSTDSNAALKGLEERLDKIILLLEVLVSGPEVAAPSLLGRGPVSGSKGAKP